MSQYKYSAKINEHRARAVGLLMPISLKQSIEICNLIRGINIQKAKDTLNNAISMKKPVPFKRFTEGAGHKHGIGPGKYPVKACREILKLVSLVEANAQHKGLDTSNLVIIHICAKKGPKSWHYGRQRRIAMKRANVEIVVEEKEAKKKEVKKEIKKAETKKPVKEEKPKLTKKQEEKKEPVKKVEEKEIKDKPKEEVKGKSEKEIKEEPEKSRENKEGVEIKKEKSKTEEIKEKPVKEELKEEEHRKIEARVEEIREKLQQEGKSQKEKVPSAFELAEKKESKKREKN